MRCQGAVTPAPTTLSSISQQQPSALAWRQVPCASTRSFGSSRCAGGCREQPSHGHSDSGTTKRVSRPRARSRGQIGRPLGQLTFARSGGYALGGPSGSGGRGSWVLSFALVFGTVATSVVLAAGNGAYGCLPKAYPRTAPSMIAIAGAARQDPVSGFRVPFLEVANLGN
jgi:hypothetical protein